MPKSGPNHALQARNEAEQELIANHQDEFDRLMEKRYKAHGLVYVKPETQEQREARKRREKEAKAKEHARAVFVRAGLPIPEYLSDGLDEFRKASGE